MEDNQVTDLLSLGYVGSPGQDHELVPILTVLILTVLRPRRRRKTKHRQGE